MEEEEREQENGESREQGEWEKRGGRERTREWREQGIGMSVRREEEEREQ